MAKENEFNETLQKSVEESVLRDNEIQKLESELKELEGLAIKTPEQAKREKEIKEVLAKLTGENKKEEKGKQQEEQKSEQPEKFNIKTANYDQLLARREERKLALEEALASPVKDPKKIEELQNELNELEKAIIALEGIEITEESKEKEDEKTEQQEKAEIEEQQKDEQDLSEKEKQEKEAKEAELKQAYYDAMVKFYAIREANLNLFKKRKRNVKTSLKKQC